MNHSTGDKESLAIEHSRFTDNQRKNGNTSIHDLRTTKGRMVTRAFMVEGIYIRYQKEIDKAKENE